MNKKLLFVFFLVLLLSLVIFYAFLKSSYLSTRKNEVAVKVYDIGFENLPYEIQKKYIKKEDLHEYGEYITPKGYYQNYSPLDENLATLSESELLVKAEDLAKKNLALIADNLDLSNKNLELISKFEEYKKQFDGKKDELLRSNNDNVSKIAKQYEEKLEQIDKKIKSRELEFLDSIKQYDQKIIKLQNEIDNIKTAKKDSELKLQKAIDNTFLLAESNATALSNANDLITKLQNNLTELEQENSDLRATIEGADDELRQSNSLFTRELDRINDGFEVQKKALEETLSKKSNELIDTKALLKLTQETLKKSISQNSEANATIKDINNMIENLKVQNSKLISDLNQTSQNLTDSKQKIIDLKNELDFSNLSVKKLKNELKKSAVAYVELEKKNSDLSDTLATVRNEKLELNNIISLKNENIDKQVSVIQNQESKITQLDAKNNTLNTNLKELRVELEKAHNAARQYRQNYEMVDKKLDEKRLENEKLHTKLMLDSNLSQIGKNINQTLDSFSLFLRSLSNKKLDQNLTVSQNIEKNVKIQKDVNKLSNEIKSLQSNNIQDTVEELLNKQYTLENENKNLRLMLDAATKIEAPKKLVLISKIRCDDMSSKNTVSSKCKSRVSEFLGRYNSNYLYEIVPVVDGRISNLLKNATKNLKPEDAKKIEEYANYGVSRQRVLVAGELVRDEYGDFARISYSSDIIFKQDSRGFEIRVYK